ncbi:tetracycline resistance protein, class C [bacterium BMS3Abin02]|nr:tetracycline resistance protein, class C [bacterium BMS3Abin02]GBE21077.1 tetracycline resistance protein, class C [bacterium BMS3Bbin01]HDL48866.1 MFS transporter [Actinomycetota bacterium]
MPRLLTRRFTLAWLANLSQEMAWALFIHFPGFLLGFGASEIEIGLLVGLTALASVVVRPWVGRAMDTYGRRPVIIAGNLGNVAVLALYLTVTGLGPWIYVVRILHGIAAALLFTSLFTYGADQVPSARRTEGLALFGISALLPIALGGLLGDAILEAGTFTDLFLTALGFAGLALLLSLPLRDAPRGTSVPMRFWASVTARNLRPLWWLTFVFAMALTAYFTFLKTFVVETGIGSVGAFFAAYSSIAITLRLFAGSLPDRVGQTKVLYPALASMTIGFVVLALAGNGTMVVAAGLLSGAGHAYAFPIMFAMVVTRSRKADRGSAIAIFTGLFDLGTLIGGPVLGAAIHYGSYPTMFFTAAAWTLLGTVVFARWEGRSVRVQPFSSTPP